MVDDQSAADELLKIGNEIYEKNSKDFDHTYSDLIHVKIYPSIEVFHRALKKPTAPDWIVGTDEWAHTVALVSPRNPGAYHSYASICTVFLSLISGLFIQDTYTNHIPTWLYLGTAFYQARWERNLQMYIEKMQKRRKNSPAYNS